MWTHITRATLAAALGVGVAACGSGAFTPPTGDTTTTTRGTGTGGDTTTGTRYGWFLPVGPSSNSTNEGILYQRLAEQKDCAAAQEGLERFRYGLLTPRNVLLYQAAIDLCRGDEPRARAVYGRIARFGWNLEFGNSTYQVDCATYQAVRSVLDQRAPDSFACARGTPPAWPDGPKDDPRTDVDEATTTRATTTTPTTTRTTAPTTPVTTRTTLPTS